MLATSKLTKVDTGALACNRSVAFQVGKNRQQCKNSIAGNREYNP